MTTAEARRDHRRPPEPDLRELTARSARRGRDDRARGGPEAIARQHAKGRKTARERIAGLLDPGSPWLELGSVGRLSHVRGVGRAPGGGGGHGDRPGGWPAGHGHRQRRHGEGRRVLPDDHQEGLEAPAIAGENRLPLVYLVDSSGVFLPMQDEVFPDDDDFGRIFRNNAVFSAGGSAARGDHGQLCRGRCVLARALRHRVDDGRLGPLSRRPGAGESGDRSGRFPRRTRRRGDALGGQRHGRLSRAG